MILVNYFFFVQLYGVLLAIAKALLLFIDGYYYRISVLGLLDILCVGQLYKERILAEQLVVDVDYAYRINTYLFGLVKVQKILNRSDAIKANWITIEGGGGEAEDAHDIEMKGADATSADDAIISVRINPLNNDVTQRNSVVFSMDGIFGTDSDEADGGFNDIYSNNIIDDDSRDSCIATENPIHSLASVKADSFRVSTSRLQGSAMQRQSSVATKGNSETGAPGVEDDESLYLEYRNLQDNSGDALYDMNDDADVAMSFEEWKIKRKQFKQGNNNVLLT